MASRSAKNRLQKTNKKKITKRKKTVRTLRRRKKTSNVRKRKIRRRGRLRLVNKKKRRAKRRKITWVHRYQNIFQHPMNGTLIGVDLPIWKRIFKQLPNHYNIPDEQVVVPLIKGG